VILGAGTFAQSSFSAVAVGLPALAPALRSQYSLSLGETGVVLGAVGIGMLLTLLGWGLLADRLSERLVIAFGLSIGGIALVAAGRTHSYGPLVGTLFLAGAFGASVNAASGRAVMGWFPADERGLALGVRQTAIPIGGAAAAAGLPWLASAGGTRLAFLVLGCACLTGALVAATLIRDAPAPGAPLGKVTRPLRDPNAWRLGIGTGLYLTAQVAITGFLVLFLHEHRGVSTRAAAALLAGVNVLGIGARIVSGRWSDSIRARLAPIRQIGVTLAVATALVAASVDAPLDVLVPSLIVAGVLSMAWNGLAVVAAAEAAGGGRVGTAIGFQQTLLALLVAGVPPAFALVAGSSWRLAFALSALGPVLGVVALRGVPEPGRVAVGETQSRLRETEGLRQP
jgi:sugar phosphate permease